MLVNAVLLGLLGGLAWIVLRQSQTRQLDDTLQLSAAQLVAAVDVTNGRLSVPPTDALVMTERGLFAWVLDSSEQINSTIGRATNWPVPVLELNNTRDWHFASGENVRLYRARLAENGGSVIIGISLQSLEESAQTFIFVSGIVAPLVLILSAAGGLFLAGRALAPITAITTQAQRIHYYNLSERLALTGPHDEVLALAQTFDDMLDRLQAAFEGERRFTADASHELRTPLSLLKAQLSLGLNRRRDAETLTQMMVAMTDDVDRMTRLVENMLALARTEAPLDSHAPVSLAILLDALTQQMQTVAADRRINLALETPISPDAIVTGDADHLRRLFTNLLDNAIKYSGDGGRVRIQVKPAVEAGINGWVVQVVDNGVGMAREHLTHVFDRFYRADASRTRQTGGTGLGLSIAQAIARQHGGHITAKSQLDQGSTFSVWLPAQRQPG